MIDKLLAKSDEGNHEGVLLTDHLRQVANAAAALAPHVGLDAETARLGGWLHDIGKAHPVFQRRINRKEDLSDQVNRNEVSNVFRHELASLFFLPLFPVEMWPQLCEMVVAHHKSVVDDRRKRGLLDLFSTSKARNARTSNNKLITNHLGTWDEWMPIALQVLDQSKSISIRTISEDDAIEALNWCRDYSLEQQAMSGWSKWRGVLMAADHMVSAWPRLYEASEEAKLNLRLKRLFSPPKIDIAVESSEKIQKLYPLSCKSSDSPQNHTLVIAPTGAGKTNYLLRRCQGRVFYLLPFQASINAMHGRLKGMLPEGTDIRLLHASSKLVKSEKSAKDQFDEEITLQPFVGAAIKVMTPHQLAKIVFAGAGFEAQLLDVQGADVVLDEVHTYSEVTQAFVLELTRVLLLNGCRIHIGTATMPSVLYNRLLELLGGEEKVLEVELTPEELKTYDRHVVHKEPNDVSVKSIVGKALDAGEKVLLVYNTVGGAQKAYQDLKEAFPDVPSMLIHSRFRRMDRQVLEQKLINEFDNPDGPCFVVSTQVVEVSLDISFDCMVTEAAPLDSLIQRFGRVNRRRTVDILDSEKRAPVHVIAPSDRTLPYKSELVKASYDCLPGQGGVLHTGLLQEMLDGVYSDISFLEIDIHVQWSRGAFKLSPLKHIGKPVLMDLLEMDGASCIRSEDETVYENSAWADRSALEIPVSGKVMWHHKDQYHQLTVGSKPFVLNTQNYDFEMGLTFKEPDPIL